MSVSLVSARYSATDAGRISVKFDDGKLLGKYVKTPNLIKIRKNCGALYMRTYAIFIVTDNINSP